MRTNGDGVRRHRPDADQDQAAWSLSLRSPPHIMKDSMPEDILRALGIGLDSLFADQFGTEFGRFRRNSPGPHYEILPIRSSDTRKFLTASFIHATGQLPAAAFLSNVIRLLETVAWENGSRPLSNRFAWHDDAIWIDLADPLWRVVAVTSTGWKIVTEPPPLFHRHRHQLPLPEPVRGGSATNLFRFLPPMSSDCELLCLVWIVLACVPTIAHPILMPVGQHGAAKSTMCRFIRTLLDPSLIPLLGHDHRGDPTLTFLQHALPAFDNVSAFNRCQSDSFCRAVTGAGSQRRKLYTDFDPVIIAFRRPILVNGICLPSVRPDFLDRSIIIEVERLPAPQPEEVLTAQFTAALPGILGGVFDLLARALELLPRMSCPSGFRMADFVRWGHAVAVAMGRTPAEFNAAYQAAVTRQAQEIGDQEPLVAAVLQFMQNQDEVTIPGKQLFPVLSEIMREETRLQGRDRNKNDSSLSKRLLEVVPVLKTLGISVTQQKRTRDTRSAWQFQRLPTVETSEA